MVQVKITGKVAAKGATPNSAVPQRKDIRHHCMEKADHGQGQSLIITERQIFSLRISRAGS